MKSWLQTQAIVFSPSITFCFILTAVFLSLSGGDDDGEILLEATAAGVEVQKQWSTRDGKLRLTAETMTRRLDNTTEIRDIRLRLERASGDMVMQSGRGALDAAHTTLSLAETDGAITSGGRRLSLALNNISYRLTDGLITGVGVSISERGGRLRGDYLSLSHDGRLIMRGNVRAVFAGAPRP